MVALTAGRPIDLGLSSKKSGNSKVFRKYRSRVVKYTVRNFGEIQLTIFKKQSKRRRDLDFCRHEEEQEELRILIVV